MSIFKKGDTVESFALSDNRSTDYGVVVSVRRCKDHDGPFHCPGTRVTIQWHHANRKTSPCSLDIGLVGVRGSWAFIDSNE